MASSITIENVDAAYGAVRVLEDVTINVKSGETAVLLGTNGNGKSTLMKCIMGIVRPTSGRIVAEIDGEKFDLVGRTPDAFEIVALTAHNLGLLYAVQGQYEKAEPLYRRALAIRERALGETHRDVEKSLGELAGLLHKMQREAEARSINTRLAALKSRRS